MISAEAEVQRLRVDLRDRGWYDSEIDQICELALSDINELILDVVANAVAEATEYAEELGAVEFIEDMDVVEMGGSFIITTRSGKTDFSKPERQMLHDLVKNGKVSEDGYKYKVIPIGKKKEIARPKNIFSDLRDKQLAQQEARASLLEKNLNNRSVRAQDMANHFKSILQNRIQTFNKSNTMQAGPATPKHEIEFRTASEKQDASTQWVMPAVKMDMTGYLMDMNTRIADTIRSSVNYIVDSYREEFY